MNRRGFLASMAVAPFVPLLSQPEQFICTTKPWTVDVRATTAELIRRMPGILAASERELIEKLRRWGYNP